MSYLVCSCGSHYGYREDKHDIAIKDMCYRCYAKSFGEFWYAHDCPYISMQSDGDQFIAQIRTVFDDTYLSVGYSSCNYAWVNRRQVEAIIKALDAEWETIIPLDLEEMMPQLLRLCKVANSVYNDDRCSNS